MARPTLRLSVKSLLESSAALHYLPDLSSPNLCFSHDYETEFPCTVSGASVNIQCDCSAETTLLATFRIVLQDRTQSAIITVALESGIPRISLNNDNVLRNDPKNSELFYSLESAMHDGPMDSRSQHILRGFLPTQATSFLWTRLVFAPRPPESCILSLSTNPKHVYNLFDERAAPINKRDVLAPDSQCLVWQNTIQKQKCQGYTSRAQGPPLPVAFRRPFYQEKSVLRSMFVEFALGMDVLQKLKTMQRNATATRTILLQWYLQGTLEREDGTKLICFESQRMTHDSDNTQCRNYNIAVDFTSEITDFALGTLKGPLTWECIVSATSPKFAQDQNTRTMVGCIPSMEFYWLGARLPQYFSIESDHITATVPDIPISLLRNVVKKRYQKSVEFIQQALQWAHDETNKQLTQGTVARYFSQEKPLFQLFNYIADMGAAEPREATAKDQAAIAKVVIDLAADSPNDWARLHKIQPFGPIRSSTLGGNFLEKSEASPPSSRSTGQLSSVMLSEHWAVEIPTLRGIGTSMYTDVFLEKSTWIGFPTKQKYMDAYRVTRPLSPSQPKSLRRFNFAESHEGAWEEVENVITGFALSVDHFQSVGGNLNSQIDKSEGKKDEQFHRGLECGAPWTNDVLCHFLEDNFPARQIQLDLHPTGPRLRATWTVTPENSSFEPAILSIVSTPDESGADAELKALVDSSETNETNDVDEKCYRLCTSAEFPQGAYETVTQENPSVVFVVANLLIYVGGYPSIHRTRRVARAISSYGSRHVLPASRVHRPILAYPFRESGESDSVPFTVIRKGDEGLLQFEAREYVTFSISFYGKGEVMIVGEEQNPGAETLKIKYVGSKIGICGVVVWLFHKDTFAAVSRSCVIEIVPAAVGRSQFKAS